MKSDVIHVKNSGAGFNEALEQAELVAKFKNLTHRFLLLIVFVALKKPGSLS